MKDIALQISNGLDASIIIVSSVLKLPKELEKFITIIEMDYPDQVEIKKQISDFSNEQGVSISSSLLEEMSVSFKGFSLQYF